MFDSDGWNTLAAFGSAIAAIAAVVGIFLTLHTFKKTQHDKQSDAILAQCEKSLEAAYDVLTGGGSSIPPERNRLNWLTSARHILRYKKLKQSLTGSHLLICDEIEEFWRYRFYVAVEKLQDNYSYYQAPVTPDPDMRSTIQSKSALVILAFSDWPENRIDPLAEVQAKSLFNGHSALLWKHAAFDRSYRELIEAESETSRVG